MFSLWFWLSYFCGWRWCSDEECHHSSSWTQRQWRLHPLGVVNSQGRCCLETSNTKISKKYHIIRRTTSKVKYLYQSNPPCVVPFHRQVICLPSGLVNQGYSTSNGNAMGKTMGKTMAFKEGVLVSWAMAVSVEIVETRFFLVRDPQNKNSRWCNSMFYSSRYYHIFNGSKCFLVEFLVFTSPKSKNHPGCLSISPCLSISNSILDRGGVKMNPNYPNSLQVQGGAPPVMFVGL